MASAAVAGAANRTLSDSFRWTETQASAVPGAIPAMVEFRVLGPLEAVVADRLVDLGAPKQRALLALLVSQVGQPVAVEAMLETLWAGNPPPSATTSLQAYVANLRRALEPGRAPRTPARVLRTCAKGYLLDGRVVDVDVHRFSTRAMAGWQAWDCGDAKRALAEFDAALALWRGQAYVEVANASRVLPEVARLEELQLSVVEARCAALLAVGAHELAVAELEAFRQAHPLREYGCELLSLALYRAGRQADALRVLRATQKRLAEELGIDPRPTLQHLEREILNHVPALDWRPGPAVASLTAPGTLTASGTLPAPSRSRAVAQVRTNDRPSWPASDDEVFVGRDEALQQMLAALADTAAGRGRVVTVTGEPGIGKTSLFRRFAKLAGVPVLWGICPEHVTTPSLWVWEQVLRAAGTCFPQHPVPAPVTQLLNGDTPRSADGSDVAGATLRRYEAIAGYLTDVSRGTPLVVLLDHLHRADPSSLRLLAHLAEVVPASQILLAVSYRSGEAATLAETLAALARSGMVRIALDGLGAAETRSLASTLLHQDVSAGTAEGLRERTEGNPFFLRELINLLTSEERLEQPNTVPVPVTVREVVLRRVARLPQTAAEVLSVAAVAGRHFDIRVVAEAASVDIDAALEALDTAVAGGLIVEDQQQLGWFRFTHALAAEALYEATGRLRRARLHRRIGVVAARVWTGNTDRAGEIARHWLLAAELDPTAAAHACAHAAAAARVVDARLAFQDAATLWRQALAAAELTDREDLDRYPLLIGLGTSLYRAGNPRDGLPVFVQAMEEALPATDVDGGSDISRLVSAAVTAVSELTWSPAEHDAARQRLVDLLERVLPLATCAAQRALVLSCLAAAGDGDGDGTRRAALSDEALALVRSTTDDMALAHVLYLRTAALNNPGHLDGRLQAVTELLALPGLPPLMTLRARQVRSQVFVTLGRVSEAFAELDLAAGLIEEQLRTPVPANWSSSEPVSGGR